MPHNRSVNPQDKEALGSVLSLQVLGPACINCCYLELPRISNKMLEQYHLSISWGM